MKIGTTEILLILALALVVFGGGKLAGVGKAMGKSIREFREEVKGPDEKKDDTNPDEAAKA